jgi:murein DD-endopeptidase MepM/ murein hydrolase activator NlpD
MRRIHTTILFLIIAGVVLAVVLARSPQRQAAVSGISVPLVEETMQGGSPEDSSSGLRTTLTPPTPTTAPAAQAASTQQAQPAAPPVGGASVPVAQEDILSGEVDSLPAVPESAEGWSPPPLEVPLARHPYDHYWFLRPIRSNYTNTGLIRYPYGSDGPNNDQRIHHGIDITNPVGVEVRAVGDGVVEWAGFGHYTEFDTIATYGNTVSIRHAVGYEGMPVYTLYAHLSAILVEEGAQVKAGDVIGLIGSTGQSSGPHVHFEVRVGRNSYEDVRNPDLWIAPYVGTGLILGRIDLPSGSPVYDGDVRVVDLETGRTVYRVPTYAGPAVNSDDNWNETFIVPNVPVGRYVLSASYGALRWTGEVTVREGMSNWVEMERYIIGSEQSPSR